MVISSLLKGLFNLVFHAFLPDGQGKPEAPYQGDHRKIRLSRIKAAFRRLHAK